MQYTSEYRMWVISEVWKEHGCSWKTYGLTKCCRAVAKDFDLSQAVVSLWVNNYIRGMNRCLAETAINSIIKEN